MSHTEAVDTKIADITTVDTKIADEVNNFLEPYLELRPWVVGLLTNKKLEDEPKLEEQISKKSVATQVGLTDFTVPAADTKVSNLPNPVISFVGREISIQTDKDDNLDKSKLQLSESKIACLEFELDVERQKQEESKSKDKELLGASETAQRQAEAAQQQAEDERDASQRALANYTMDMNQVVLNMQQDQSQLDVAYSSLIKNYYLTKTLGEIGILIDEIKSKKPEVIKAKKLAQIHTYLSAISSAISNNTGPDNLNNITLEDTRHVYCVFTRVVCMFKYLLGCIAPNNIYSKSKTYQTVSPVKDAISTHLENTPIDEIDINKVVLQKHLGELVESTAPAQN